MEEYKYIVERCPGRRRSVLFKEIDDSIFQSVRVTKLHTIEHPDLVFVSCFNTNSVRHIFFVFVEENNNWFLFDAPNTNVGRSRSICFGTAFEELVRRLKEGKPPRIADLYWSTIFVGGRASEYSFKKLLDKRTTGNPISVNLFREQVLRVANDSVL